MASDTLAAGIEQYQIGPRIRALRKGKKLGLVQLGEHSGLSPGLLSKIERGRLVPTLPTLMRIAMVFGVGLEHFFTADERPIVAVVRRAERLRLPDRPGKGDPSYFFESLDFPVTDRRMDAYLAAFPPGAAPSEPHRHRRPHCEQMERRPCLSECFPEILSIGGHVWPGCCADCCRFHHCPA
jgi:transcriptional regulator with XRE-family HTH domain